MDSETCVKISVHFLPGQGIVASVEWSGKTATEFTHLSLRVREACKKMGWRGSGNMDVVSIEV